VRRHFTLCTASGADRHWICRIICVWCIEFVSQLQLNVSHFLVFFTIARVSSILGICKRISNYFCTACDCKENNLYFFLSVFHSHFYNSPFRCKFA